MKTETAEKFYFSWKETPEGKDVWNRYGPDEISSIAIAFAEAYVSRVSSKAAGQDELKEFGAWFDKEFRTDLTITKSERRMARYAWEERARRAGLSSQEGK